jgi:trehalose 6-phosphate synthase/phosphatase
VAEDVTSGRVLTVANRLPITLRVDADGVVLTESAGGVATGLRSAHASSGGLWIGWPGEVPRLSHAEQQRLDGEFEARGILPVYLTTQDVRQYYEGFSNGVIWPLFHYLLDRIPLDAKGWDGYRRVNEKFADAVASAWRPGDVVWVHDYQLMLVPGLVRQRLPDARVGFFLHIPFPAPEVFRTLPWRDALLEGLLGADLVGFHTSAYARHFSTSLRYLLGVPADLQRAESDGREVRIDSFPMGIDVAEFERLASLPSVIEEARRVREESGGRRILLGVDRLDYTKGIPRRMLAFERFLERTPALREQVRLIQVAVPTRPGVEHYQAFRRGLDEIIGRINGRFGSLTSMPLHYVYRSLPAEQVAALYLAADVMLVTPLRDGMNLVAKEFVATRTDGDGVLVLSEFAGAAAELGEALIVNPYDVDGVATVIGRALALSEAERRTRMRALRERVCAQDVQGWAQTFVERLRLPPRPRQMTPGTEMAEVTARARAAARAVLLLDYDGTLVPIVSGPSLAAPDEPLLALLGQVADVPSLDVHLVSGRKRETMEAWFGELRVGLWAEHGLWYRPPGGTEWEMTLGVSREWMDRVRPLVASFTRRTAGSLVEEKTASFAWHYRMADPEIGEQRARELREALRQALAGEPLEILNGSKVIEVRSAAASKALAVARLANDEAPLVVALGDDRTDEDLFVALPADGISIHVGPLPSRARYRVRDWRAARQFLRDLAGECSAPRGDSRAGAAARATPHES